MRILIKLHLHVHNANNYDIILFSEQFTSNGIYFRGG